MKGLALARQYGQECVLPMLQRDFPIYMDKVAVGLVGEGSECFGFDDQWSQDHDFGPGVCIWLPQKTYDEVGEQMQKAYRNLPTSFAGFHGRNEQAEGVGRVGVFSVDGFYSKYTNAVPYPIDALQWLKIPSEFLATATNGEVFVDYLGEFSTTREVLRGFYPKDVKAKKTAAKLAKMAQAGQYNYPRMLKRGDGPAAYLSFQVFVQQTLAACFLLNNQYMPFYKWQFRATESFTRLKEVIGILKRLIVLSDVAEHAIAKQSGIEEIARLINEELSIQGFGQAKSLFLTDAAHMVMAGIGDVRLKSLPLTFDVD